MSFEEFQHGPRGGQFGYRNGTILAILNFCVTVMLPIKFCLNPTYILEGNVVWRISRRPSWTSERNDSSNSESLCRSDAPSNLGSIWPTVWEMSFEEFQDGSRGGHLGYWNGKILAILNLCVIVMPPIKFWHNPTYGLEGDISWRISRWQPSRISELNDFIYSKSLCHCNASHQVSAQSDLGFWRRCRLKNFKMAPMASLGIGTQRS